ncbi:monosaccharide ABC transporter membrane protein (CUT2 family) [Propionicimonas paludicola]|uniref:Monosaccharide ABC transporter membrane protein (CUT2 family) n=1 Tax=Propionicimonas paludicola TaxID=185243 RepID=A0A2A9CUV9_9ACTN|nr:ABC transporter permease [Propionicimonas paludicola]PFG17921.1 monosaccharide ABC transporter membrane protein (CUT2 family) [Propionicimonas paludicola]
MQLLRKFRGANNEGSLALILLVVVLGMSLLNPVFFSVNTAFSILRAATVPMILALAVLLVIISGGIDVSFPVVAIGSAYTAVTICLKTGFDPGLPAIFGMAIIIGGLLGLVNGFVIAKFRLPTLIVTLGTQGIFFGAMLVYVGTRYYPSLPASMAALSAVNVVELTTGAGRAYLHVLVLLSIAIAIAIWAVLKFTMFGRALYAIGGDVEGARRAGIRVVRTQLLIYVLVGMVAAIGGVAYVVMSRSANPQDLVGGELDIIAAVVLGGASIFGGRGSVLGTVLGVLLIQVINNSLLLVGVPSAWLRAAVGLLLILGVGVQAVSARRNSQRIHTVDDAVEAAGPELEKVS